MQLTIRSAQASDTDAVSAVLAAAFADDPVMDFVWPDRRRRLRALPRYFAVMLRTHHLSGGGVDIAVDPVGRIVSAAVWDPPCRWKQPLGGAVRAIPQLARALTTRVPAALAVRRTLDRHHPTTPHWYLCQFGTLPHQQGCGAGTQLLRRRLAACAEDDLPAFLVSNRSATIPLYRSVGFLEDSPITISGGPQVWPMWRPHTASADR
jgi:GNAT superfamily N-acetyltransferase